MQRKGNFLKDELNLIQILKLIAYTTIGVIGYIKVNYIIHLLQAILNK